MVLIKTQQGMLNYVLESTDKVIFLGTFSTTPLGTWTALRVNDESGSAYQVPADKTFTITNITYNVAAAGNYIDMKYDTSSSGSSGTRFEFAQSWGTAAVYTCPYAIDIPTGNYVKVQKNIGDIGVKIIGVEHDT